MTDEKKELFFTDIQSIVELYKPTYLEQTANQNKKLFFICKRFIILWL